MTTIEILQGVKDWITNLFARQNGFYETMGVGTAVNLAGQTERTDDAMYRKSGGSEEVATGLATIPNIKGNTVAWNQRATGQVSASSTTSNVSIEHGVEATTEGNYIQEFITIVPVLLNNHKYIFSYRLNDSSSPDTLTNSQFVIFNNIGGVGQRVDYTPKNNSTNSFIFTVTIDASRAQLQIRNTTASFSVKITYIQLFDLTLIYGAGNEPTSVAQFEADYFKWFGKPLTYEDYDEGSLRSVQLDAMKTTGFNQYNNGTAKVIGGLQYQITGTYTSIALNDETITPDANGLFTPSTTGSLTIVGGGSDTCVHISGERNGTYEPYEEHVASIPVTTLKGKLNGQGESVTIFPDGMRSAGTIHDEIYTVGDKTYAVQRVGSVDLGTLNWRISGSYIVSVNLYPYGADTHNSICPRYKTVSMSALSPDMNKTLAVRVSLVYVRDETYSDATTFKTAMSGVMLYYELATPLVYEVDDFALPKRYLVDGGGTEEQVQKANVQGLAAILTCIYGVDAVGILNKLPQNYVAVNESQQFTELQKAQARNNIGAYSKPNDGIPVSDINLTNLPEIGIGYGICTTDTYEASKVVSIPNFLLLQDAIINVLFTTPINSSNSTLNVNNTGAKPIKALDSALPSGVIKAQSIVTFVYNNNAWNIINVFTPDASFDPDELVVDMGLPSGVKWAARDIDLTKEGGFCDTPFTYNKSFFSWGNIDGHNPISNSKFDYNWGGVNHAEPWHEGQPYGETKGSKLTGNIAVGEEYDCARANLGEPWRMPTSANYTELFRNIIYINADGTEVDTTKTDKRVTVNGVLGLYLQSKINGARLFFACSGYGYGTTWDFLGSYGFYWSSSFYSSRDARVLDFHSGGVLPQYYRGRYNGFAVRAVQ